MASLKDTGGIPVVDQDSLTIHTDAPLGTSGNAFRGEWNDHGVVAVRLLSGVLSDTLTRRVEIWKSAKHNNVQEILAVSSTDVESQFLVTHLQQNGNVKAYVSQNPSVDRAALAFETALGMQFLHSIGIVHGGLKPSNILVKDNGSIAISDYNLIEIQPGKDPEAHRYFSPEAWKGTISKQSDVYAFAMSALEIFTSIPPWGFLSETQIYRLVAREEARPDRPECAALTDRIWGILEESWHKESRLRPSFDILVRMWTDAPRNAALANNYDSHILSVSEEPPHRSSSTLVSVPPAYEVEAGETQLMSQLSLNPLPAPRQIPPDISVPSSPPWTSPLLSSSPSSSSTGSSAFTIPTPPPTGRPFTPRALPFAPPTSPGIAGNWNPRNDSRQNLVGPQPKRAFSADSTLSYANTRSFSVLSPSPLARRQSTMPLPPAPESSISQWARFQRQLAAEGGNVAAPDNQSVWSDNTSSGGTSSSQSGPSNAVLLSGALQAEMKGSRNRGAIDRYLTKMLEMASHSEKDAERLVTAGAIPTLIHLLKTRAAEPEGGFEMVLIVLGTLAHDSISANTIYRTNTVTTLAEIFTSTPSNEIAALSAWCLNRICRNTEVASGLVKHPDLVQSLCHNGLRQGNYATPSMAAYCLGTLAQTDALAETLEDLGAVRAISTHLQRSTESPHSSVEDVSSALYAIARISRSIRLAKSFARAGCIPLIAHQLTLSDDPKILQWCARAVGCLMRPNSSDMSRILLDAGVAKGLARMPHVLPPEEVEPLSSFAFAIQRFSCAEWGAGTRKALVDAGVVDSLLAALRTAADEPYPQVHVDLALAVSFLGDVGGSSIRKEIGRAGGVDILKRVGSAADEEEVRKACNLAVTSLTGNIWTRNAASAKTAMAHNWNGGCPDYQPGCPLVLTENGLADSEPL